MSPASSHHRDLRRIVLASLVVGMLVIGGVLGVVFFAAGAIDRLEMAKEQALVQRRLDRTLEGLIEDLNSATVWNDAVPATTGVPDLEWIQVNFGDYFADYMDHDATLVYAGDGRLIQASRDSEPVAADSEAALTQAVALLVAQVRAESSENAKRKGVAFDAVVNRTAIVGVGSEIYLVGTSTVVPEDTGTARPAQDAVVVSARTLTSFIESLPADLMIEAPRLIPATDAAPALLAVTDPQGNVLGRIAWRPDRPGQRLLQGAAPMLAGIFLLLLLAGVVLSLAVGRVAKRLVENQTALAEARDRAEAANVAKSRFLSNMSHELRTPLNGVLGMAEVMGAGDLSPIQRSHLAVLKASGADLLHLIEQVLEVSRLDKGELQLTLAPLDLLSLVDRVMSYYASRAGRKGLSLSADVRVHGRRLGDEARLSQALASLLDNAVTFTERGEVRIEAVDRGHAVHIRVMDTGPGIPPEALPHLFDRFVQADDSSTRRFDGAGLGLAICRDIVRAMGGEVSVESSADGSVFTVSLPLPDAETGTKAMAA
jgi:signal transduction histidine kinase